MSARTAWWPRPQDQRGTAVPALLAVVLVTAVMGLLFLRVGRAADLSAGAQTGADAAALAAATDIREQIYDWVLSGAWNERAFTPDQARATRAARSYADANAVQLARLDVRGVGYLRFEVDAETVTRAQISTVGPLVDPAPTAEAAASPTPTDQPLRPGEGAGARQTATAVVAPDPGGFLAGAGYWAPGGAGPPPAVVDGGGGCAIPAAELRRLAETAGLDPEFGLSGHGSVSVLARYSRCDGPGVAVAPMPEPMKISLLRLESAMGEPLVLASGYRSPAYQAVLCTRVAGPCAAPGRSMHNLGLAVDVVNHAVAAAAAARDPAIGLCQPLPRTDAVHLSHVSGRECGGRTGTAGAGSFQPFGGAAGLAAQSPIAVALIR